MWHVIIISILELNLGMHLFSTEILMDVILNKNGYE